MTSIIKSTLKEDMEPGEGDIEKQLEAKTQKSSGGWKRGIVYVDSKGTDRNRVVQNLYRKYKELGM